MIEQLQLWVDQFLVIGTLIQFGALAAAVLLGLLVSRVLRRPLDNLGQRLNSIFLLDNLAWVLEIFVVLEAVVLPVALWLFTLAAAALLGVINQPASILEWVAPLFGLWAIYRGASTFIRRNLKPGPAKTWLTILKLAIAALVILQSLTLLDNILSYSFQAGGNILISLRSLLLGIGVFFLFYFLSRSVRQLLRDDILPRTGIDPSLNQVISTFTGYGLIVAGLLLGLSLMGIPLSTLTVIAGGLSVGIGFGLQELINNFVSGFILLTERSLTPGDVIEVDDHIGVVGEINLRTIAVRTVDNVQLIVPNGQLLQSVVTSYTRNDKRVRMHVQTATSMEANPHEAIEAMLEAAAKQDNLLAEPAPEALFTGIGDRALEFELLVWVSDPLPDPQCEQQSVTANLGCISGAGH